MATSAAKRTDTVFLCAAEPSLLSSLRKQLRTAGFRTATARGALRFRRLLQSRPDVIAAFIEISSSFSAGGRILRWTVENRPELFTVAVAAGEPVQRLLHAWRLGADSYIQWPERPQRWHELMQTLLSLARERRAEILWPQLVDEFSCKMTFRSGDDPCDCARTAVTGFLDRIGEISPAERQNLLLVLEEAVRNAMEHGNLELKSEWKSQTVAGGSRFEKERRRRLCEPRFADRKVCIEVKWSGGVVELTVSDEGNGFDPEAYHYNADGRGWGMGLKIMMSLMDEVRFNDKGNRVTLRKRLTPMREQASQVQRRQRVTS